MSTINLHAVSKLAEVVPEGYAETLKTTIPLVEQYPDDEVYLADQLVPILQVLTELKDTPEYADLIEECWEEMFKGGASFNREYIEQNLDAKNPIFMKYLDVAIYSANPELGHKVGITRKPNYD